MRCYRKAIANGSTRIVVVDATKMAVSKLPAFDVWSTLFRQFVSIKGSGLRCNIKMTSNTDQLRHFIFDKCRIDYRFAVLTVFDAVSKTF